MHDRRSALQISSEKEMELRRRDRESGIDVDDLSRQFEIAKQKGLMLIPLEHKNRAQFAQMISPNIRYLVSQKHLTTAELAFLTSISGNIELHTNAIVSFDEGQAGQFMKIAEIAGSMGYSERQASRIVNGLIGKGIIYEFTDSETIKRYGRVLEERPLFLNPEIIYSGDKNRIDGVLCRLIMPHDHLEKDKMKLPWKLWIESGQKDGKLYMRDTWLKKKKESKDKK